MTTRQFKIRHSALALLLSTFLGNSVTAFGENAIYFSTLDDNATDMINQLVDEKETSTHIKALEDIPEPTPFVQSNTQYSVLGKTYTVAAKAKNFKQTGLASWYGKQFHGQKTASGERYDMHELTAAHKTLPIPCYARITNTENGKSVIVKINDRGPFHSNRILDVSQAAAKQLDMLKSGMAKIKLEVVSSADDDSRTIATTSKPIIEPALPRFFVQVGAFSSADNALNLQNQLSSQIALPIEVTDANSGTMTHKVQVGPFVDEITAQKARNYILQLTAVSNPVVVKF